MIGQRFSYIPETKNFPVFAEGSVNIGGTPSTQAGSLPLCLSLQFMLQKASVSGRGSSSASSHGFPEHPHNAGHAYGFLQFQEYARAFQIPYTPKASHSQAFLPRSLPKFQFIASLKHLPAKIFAKCLPQ